MFVGDTHGDVEATQRVLTRFPPGEHVLVFLGDYVDRGPASLENLVLLARSRIDHPESVVLLMGNHEGWAATSFSPADFWETLSPEEEEAWSGVLSLLPFAAYHPQGLLAVHGAIPAVESLEEIEGLPLGSPDWKAIVWGDWSDASDAEAETALVTSRPAFGADHFAHVTERLELRAVVRSHQPTAPTHMYDGRCLTVFTSHAYGGRRRQVATLHPDRPLRTARDLELVDLG